MRSLKQLVLSTLVALAVWITSSAAWEAQRIYTAFDKAKTEVLGTLHCKRDSGNTWKGEVQFHPTYGKAHGLKLIQPAKYPIAWEEATVKGELRNEKTGQASPIEASGFLEQRCGRNELIFSIYRERDPSSLSITLTGVDPALNEDTVDIDLMYFMCGCEKMAGFALTIMAGVGLLVTLFFVWWLRLVTKRSIESPPTD